MKTPTPLAATLIRKGETATFAHARRTKLGTIAMTVRLDPDRYARIKAEAAETGKTAQDIFVEALDARWA